MIMYAVAQPETQALNLDEWTRYRSIIDNLSRGPVPQPVYSPRPKKMRRLNTPGPPRRREKALGLGLPCVERPPMRGFSCSANVVRSVFARLIIGRRRWMELGDLT
jgi:hypothetical protein